MSDELEELCRLCGSEGGIKVNIFEPDSDHVKKIHRILPISVNEHDFLPKTMCHRCSFKVNDFYEFRINCIRAQDMFKSKLPWLKNKTNMMCGRDDEHPPMVELPLNSINFVSPSEKRACNEPEFVDENDPLIVIEDSPPYVDKSALLQGNHNPQEKIIMKIKRSELKKRTKSKSIWDTKKRRRRTYNSCRITEVFTTSLDTYESLGGTDNDPLGIPTTETNENKSNNQMVLDINLESELKSEQEKEKVTKDDIKLPTYILVTNIPRVGFVYTCEKCGRTFLSPQPASLHTCYDVDIPEDSGSKDESRDKSPKCATDFYNCNECNQLFSRQSQLIAHKKKHYEVVSSSDDSVKPVSRRKKLRKGNKVKSHLMETANTPSTKVNIENGIIRHSLLSSDSD